MGKSARKPHPKSTSPDFVTEPQVVTTGLMGLISLTTLHNIGYMTKFTDVYSRFSALYFLKHKASTSVLDRFLNFKEIFIHQLVGRYVCVSCSTIGKGGDATIPSPRRSPKQPLPGIGLHDVLHGRQACPESNSFHQGVGHTCPR